VSANRSVVAGMIVAGTLLVAWATWPRPSVVIRIARGGAAAARGRNTVVRVVNDDTLRHALALFAADPGATTDYTIAYPGTYGGSCSAHPSGNLTYVVR
jgi:hypothetical protein